ncbi:hypothetical protein BC332_34620 [Capsicum chinense]|nr:hypothetical protein BC332_34620 [Capsicum chinense]
MCKHQGHKVDEPTVGDRSRSSCSGEGVDRKNQFESRIADLETENSELKVMLAQSCFEWFKRFKTGQESVEDEEHGNRPSTAPDFCHKEEVGTKALENGRLELAEQCDISEDSVHTILIEYLHMHRVSAKLVPQLLSVEQKSSRV